MESRERVDVGLFHKGTTKKKGTAAAAAEAAANEDDTQTTGSNDKQQQQQPPTKKKGERGAHSYYRVTCEDNGCGMAHDRIPDMLGRVLSSSKYGVRQTRGKFGLGSKMALIWSKKSTGLPIEIRSAHSTDPGRSPSYVSRCILDIDIYRNEPSVKLHEKVANEKQWRGTRIDVVVEGNWTTYKSYIMNYFQQLAIITPYAQMDFTFRALSNAAREITTQYARRSDQMPPPAQEVKHHPSSVNHLIIQQLLKRTKAKTLVSFLSTELACVTKPLAARIVKELGGGFTEGMAPHEVDANKTIRLTSLLKSVSIFKPPDGSCLSPAGEYNLRLGIMKELHPDVSVCV
jgi:DNA topoisomerase VI B subunit